MRGGVTLEDVFEVLEGGRRDGEVLGLDFEHVEILVGHACEHGDQETNE